MANVCPDCGETFEIAIDVCPHDGAHLSSRTRRGRSLIGETIDERFRLESKLGEGGMGRVYTATQLSVERRVAIKLIRTRGGDDRELTERFLREARVISGFTHPNIVRLIDFGHDERLEVPYLAMEYVDGLELTELMTHARLHPTLALEIANQIAAALVEAHQADIIHRDLKRENVLLVPVSTEAFQAKVIDFGLAFSKRSSMDLTQTGAVCGTPEYVSPEQAHGLEVDSRSDLYSLGVILFEMLTGRLPFQADSPFDIMLKHVENQPPSLSARVPGSEFPEPLERLVADLLEKDPGARPEGGREIRRRIDTVREQLETAPIRTDAERPLLEALDPWLIRPTEQPADPDTPNAPEALEIDAPAESTVPDAAPISARSTDRRTARAEQADQVTEEIDEDRGRFTARSDLEGWAKLAAALTVVLVGLGAATILVSRSGDSGSPSTPSRSESAPDERTGSPQPHRTGAAPEPNDEPATATAESDDTGPAPPTAASAGTAGGDDAPSSADDAPSEPPSASEHSYGGSDPPAKEAPDETTSTGETTSARSQSSTESDSEQAPDDDPESSVDSRHDAEPSSGDSDALRRGDETPNDVPGGDDEDDDIDSKFEKSVDWLTDE